MKAFLTSACSLPPCWAIGAVHAEIPSTALHVVTAARSDLVVHPGDYIQLEHTYLLIQSPPKDASASSSDKNIHLVKTLRVMNPKVLGAERATIGALFKAETPGRSILNLEIVEKNGKHKIISCQVDVR